MTQQAMPKETQEKITQLQMLEQAVQASTMQKQQVNSQLIEISSALEELEKTEKAYKIVGNLMINAKKDELKTNLSQKKEMLELKLKTLESQEERLKEKSKKLQEEVMKTIKE